jgi:hypothetical protein
MRKKYIVPLTETVHVKDKICNFSAYSLENKEWLSREHDMIDDNTETPHRSNLWGNEESVFNDNLNDNLSH